MDVSTYPDADQFLAAAQDYLEADEVRNATLLGVSLGLQHEPPHHAPLLAAVADAQGIALVAVMTPPYRLMLNSHRDDPADAVQTLIRHLQETRWTVPAVLGPPQIADTFVRRWGQPYTPGIPQRLFVLRKVITPATPPGRFRIAMRADLDVIAGWVREFQLVTGGHPTRDEARAVAEARIAQGRIYVWEHENLVSMAATTRPTRHSIAVNYVYTPNAERRKGYASACVAGLSQTLLDSGYAFCTLFTDRTNPTSNHIYQEIGYRPVCDIDEYLFS